MARAIEWATNRDASAGNFLAVNTGSNNWNYQVKDLAQAVAGLIPGTTVLINRDAPPDKRSYRVNFNLYKSLAPNHQPLYTLQQTILELHQGLIAMHFKDANFRNSFLMRLKALTSLQESNKIDKELKWVERINHPGKATAAA
jgi:hypothetical protein